MRAYTRGLVAALAMAGALFGTIGGFLARPAFAQTYFERVPATVCKATIPGSTSEAYGVATTWLYAFNDGGSAAHFVCPVPDKTDLMQGNISEIRVDVDDWNNDNNVSVDARVCAFDSEDSSSGACGDWEKSDATTTFTGSTTLVLDSGSELSALGDADETAYLWVVLPAKDGASICSINGLYFEDD